MTYVILLWGTKLPDKPHVFTALLLATIILSTSIGAMLWWGITNQPPPIEYGEILEYQGEDLSSINAFSENSIKGPQHINITDYNLIITGLVANDQQYTYDEVVTGHQSYKKVITMYCVEGWSVTILWEGIRLSDLFAEAQVDPKATVVIFYAYDGYTTSLPLDFVIDNNIMIAYKMNNVTLPPERGYPFQLVAEGKMGYKWIKWITAIELSDNEDFRGFWESYGYPNDANLY
jgi:DMSO/TMAO reductase YedYZ molybdopterin-dependent catalytic subunit